MSLVWISTARRHASNLRPLRHDLAEAGDRGTEWFDVTMQRIKLGEPVAADKLPQTIFGSPDAPDSAYRLPDLFYAYGFWAVSAKAAAVLRTVDLGSGVLSPVRVLKRDRTTPVEGEWYCFSIGNQKAALLPEQSLEMRVSYISEGRKGWFPRFGIKDDDIAVSAAAALSKPDIWIDPDTGDAVFLSAELAAALKKAKADKGWFLNKCRVL